MRCVPTFHDDVRVLLGRPLLRNEAPCLLPALQPGPEGRKGWVRLSVLHPASRGLLSRGSPDSEGSLLPAWTPLPQAVGNAGPF